MEKFSELAKLNYPSRLINNILYDNLHNAIKRILKVQILYNERKMMSMELSKINVNKPADAVN